MTARYRPRKYARLENAIFELQKIIENKAPSKEIDEVKVILKDLTKSIFDLSNRISRIEQKLDMRALGAAY
jgi:peptidoglycan hydrolase CwlO-like protein